MDHLRISLVILVGIAFLFTGNAWAVSGTKMVVGQIWGEKEMKGVSQPIQIVSHNSLAPGKSFLAFLRKAPQPTLSATTLREDEYARAREKGTKRIVSFLRKR